MFDINFFHNPKDLKPLTSKYYNYFFPKYAKVATRIATVSEYSKADISKNYHIDSNKIDVVYNGINDGFHPLSEIEQQATREKFSHGKPYFLFVGSQSPRKNLNRLIGAFDLLKGFSIISKNFNRPVEAYILATIVYFIICFSLSYLVKRIQNRVRIVR